MKPERTHRKRPDPAGLVLAALLLDPGKIQEARDRVTERTFYRPEHRAIWRTALEIHDAGMIVNHRTVSDRLLDAGDMRSACEIVTLLDPDDLEYTRDPRPAFDGYPLTWWDIDRPLDALLSDLLATRSAITRRLSLA